MLSSADVIDFFSQLEGPYRWYAISAVVIILTALVTRFIFKTLKWFLLIAAGVLLVFTVAVYVLEFIGGL